MGLSGAGFDMADFLGAISGTVRPGRARPVVVHAAELETLPAGQVHQYPDSNAWAASDGSTALLAGDPHLPQTLPSVWYEVALAAPGYDVSGVSVPGLPGILLGHNANIAWSLTDTQNAATRYYAERVRGDFYYWRGAWRPMTVVHYTIPVRGGATVNLAVDITVHGPIMTQVGQRMAVDWMGNVPSDDIAALFGINEATDFTQFRSALTGWRAPTQNFVYADKAGNIGVIAPGYYPQVAAGCQPWLPMPGTGACDVTGVIPVQAVPQVYDPPSHLIVTANQRPVTAAYPYYIGTSADFYDPGYRASYAYKYLASHEPLSAASVAALQNNVTDSLASRVLPSVLTALGTASLSSSQRSVVSLLSSWNYAMDAGSAAATVWWTFWDDYLTTVFEPWWKAGKVPVGRDVDGLAVGPGQAPLDEDLEAWTLNDASNAAFRGPSGRGPGSAPAAMVAAFRQAVTHLSAKFGGSPSTWTWGREHARSFPSVEDAAGLGYGPRAASGDPFSEDAADGGLTATTGPSWRMIVTFDAGALSAVGVYPGGQSENPASPWYTNLVPLWWDGQYLPLPVPGAPVGSIEWSLHG